MALLSRYKVEFLKSSTSLETIIFELPDRTGPGSIGTHFGFLGEFPLLAVCGSTPPPQILVRRSKNYFF